MERPEVFPVVVEATHITEPPVADQPLAATLPAPVEGGDGKAARLKVGDGLEILLDELGASLHQADGPLGRPLPLGKGGVAQLHLVRCGEIADPRALRHRVGRHHGKGWPIGVDDGVHKLPFACLTDQPHTLPSFPRWREPQGIFAKAKTPMSMADPADTLVLCILDSRLRGNDGSVTRSSKPKSQRLARDTGFPCDGRLAGGG